MARRERTIPFDPVWLTETIELSMSTIFNGPEIDEQGRRLVSLVVSNAILTRWIQENLQA
ncbi:MAG: hypothetical protein ACTH4Y_08285 [Microbacterium gubbeenense]|uniref:hypothetical protein n=1 Tax=Microbacterium gubbeenense TaxID=159896 RepID=UPI003F99DB07